ncbi:MAG: hypothetical protein ACRD2A_15125, partial [Vicinamibacterales bacterium]
MRQGRRLIPILASTLLALSCAGRRPASPVVPPAPAIEDVSNLIEHGCYRCLEKAFANAQARNARQQAFEAATLLALRSKELGLPPALWLERAREFAAADGSSFLYMDIVEAIPPDRLS